MKQYLLTIAMLIMAHAQASLANPIHDAARRGDLAAVRAILTATPRELNARDHNNETPLFGAVWTSHTDIARLLLDRGADVDARDLHNETPLHKAAAKGNTGIVRLLLDADVNARDHYNETPLHKAAQNGYTEVVFLLIAHGATVSDRERSAAAGHWIIAYRDAIKAMLTPEGIAQIHREIATAHTKAGAGALASNKFQQKFDRIKARPTLVGALSSTPEEIRLKDIDVATAQNHFKNMCKRLLALVHAPGITLEKLNQIEVELDRKAEEAKAALEKAAVKAEEILVKVQSKPLNIYDLKKRKKIDPSKLGETFKAQEALEGEAAAVRAAIAEARAVLQAPPAP